MAFTTLFKLTTDAIGPVGTDKKIYNITFPVSTFAGGDKVDVMLVQALFRLFYYELMGFGPPDPPAQSSGVIVVDGICGPQTRIHITHFQNFCKTQGFSTTTDGEISPFKKQGVLTSRTNKRYQLESLNGMCMKFSADSGEGDLHQRMIDLDQHEEDVYPPQLRTALLVPVFMV